MTRPIDPITLVPLAWPSDAVLTLPGSKSVANRMLVAAALCGSEVVITGVPASDDVLHMIAGLRTLGFRVQFGEATERAVVGPRRTGAPSRGELYCGNAGTAVRFLVSVAAITPGEWTITGDAAMQSRPIGPLVSAWRQLGISIHDTDGCPPVRVRSSNMPLGGHVHVAPGESSQFVSSLLLVGNQLSEGLKIHFDGAFTSAGYVELTRSVLQHFGIIANVDADRATVEPGARTRPSAAQVDADWSSAGAWTCLNHLTGSRSKASNLRNGSWQPDEGLIDVLRAMPPAGEHTIDVAAIPDQFMNLAIVAAHRAGTTRLVGAANLRRKESDRIAVMARELTKLGADVRELPDGLVIRGGRPLRDGTVDPQGDHRVAMAFALAGLLSPGITIADAGCVTKSYPRFWQDLEAVRAQRRCVAVVGMRGAGKSTFARAFAVATGAELFDTDDTFTTVHGPIASFVAQHGWPAFREHEAHFVERSLRRGAVVATGGGATESANTRRLLRERALVVWLDGDASLLRGRLAAAPQARPSLTGAPPLEEVDGLLARRNPLYAEIAHVRIDATLQVVAQVEAALRELGKSCRWPGASTPA